MQRITFSSNLTVDHAISLPEFQNRYGASGETSWGAENASMKAYDNVGDYFSNGVTATNSLSVTAGKEKMQTYFSYANTTASGSEVYVYSETSPAFPLGEAILVGLQNATGLRNRGMFIRPSLYVLRRTNMPALLVEMGYLTNPEDARLLSTDPQSFARGIYNGMLSYFQLT